ncbi:MAG: serine/threonine-protein kinase [Planctomycetota bacterium]
MSFTYRLSGQTRWLGTAYDEVDSRYNSADDCDLNPNPNGVGRMPKLTYDEIQLGAILGTGTVGTVYRATFKTSGEEVAVKVLQDAISSDELVRKRFRREMQILERLQHPHIIRYYGGGEHDGQLFFAMELLEGGNVRDLLDRFGQLSWQECASIGRQVCSALQAAHNNGIIHRDLKPGNLFLDADASVKLGDFGIARDTQAADITSQGLTVGTHAYMSPEQIKGEGLSSGKTDLYSLGCVLFELLTGHKPFEGTNFAVLFEQHLHKKAPDARELVPDCPPAMANIITELLSKSPDDRPFNARAVQGVLQELLSSYGLKSQGVRIDGDAKPDVAAGAVREKELLDPGQTRLAQKLQPLERPELSWKVIGLIAIIIVGIVAFAAIQNA